MPRGNLPLGVDFRNEGVLGTVFTGRLVAETHVAGRPAVVPTISGAGGLPATPAMCWTQTTPSRRGSR